MATIVEDVCKIAKNINFEDVNSKNLFDNFGLHNFEKSSQITSGKIVHYTKNNRKIRGYMSIPEIDLEGDVIAESAYPEIIKIVKTRYAAKKPIPMFVEHRKREISLPVGVLSDAGSDSKGLWFEAIIGQGMICDPIWELIEQGILYGVSIGGEATKSNVAFNTKLQRDVKYITNAIIRELSLTGLPVNEGVTLEIAKSMVDKSFQGAESIVLSKIQKSLNDFDNHVNVYKSVDILRKAQDEAEEGKQLSKDQIGNIMAALANLKNALNQAGANIEDEEIDNYVDKDKSQNQDDSNNQNDSDENTESDDSENNQEGEDDNTSNESSGEQKNSEQDDQNSESDNESDEAPEKVNKYGNDNSESSDGDNNKTTTSSDENETNDDKTSGNEESDEDSQEEVNKKVKNNVNKSILKCSECGEVYETNELGVRHCYKDGSLLKSMPIYKDKEKNPNIIEKQKGKLSKKQMKLIKKLQVQKGDREMDVNEGLNAEKPKTKKCKSCKAKIAKKLFKKSTYCPNCGSTLKKEDADMDMAKSLLIKADEMLEKSMYETAPARGTDPQQEEYLGPNMTEEPGDEDYIGEAPRAQGSRVNLEVAKSLLDMANEALEKAAQCDEDDEEEDEDDEDEDIEKNLTSDSGRVGNSGYSVAEYEGEEGFIKPNRKPNKLETPVSGSDLHEYNREYDVPKFNAADPSMFASYNTTVSKSLEDKITDMVSNTIAKATSQRKGVVPSNIEKSVKANKEIVDRSFAKCILGK